MRSRLLLVLGIVWLVAGCAGLREEARVGPYPGCDTTNRGRLLLMAQSVPEASMIPCLGELPPGWEFAGALTHTSKATLVVTTDTFDLDVEIVLTPACDVSEAGQVPSGREGVTLYRQGDDRTLSYLFEGGCVRVLFPTSELAASPHAGALIDEIRFLTREELRTLSGWEL